MLQGLCLVFNSICFEVLLLFMFLLHHLKRQETCCRRSSNKLMPGLLIHGEGLIFGPFLETAGNILSASTARISTKLKDNFVSRPLQNNRGYELLSALKQNFNLQAHPALLFICRALLVLVKVSAEVRKSYRVCRILPLPLPNSSSHVSWFPKASDLSRWGQKYMGKLFQMLWFSVNISIMTGHFWCIITAAVEYNKLCLIWNIVSIYRIRKTVSSNQESGIAWGMTTYPKHC